MTEDQMWAILKTLAIIIGGYMGFGGGWNWMKKAVKGEKK